MVNSNFLDCLMKLRLVLGILIVLGSEKNSSSGSTTSVQLNDDFILSLSSGASILSPSTYDRRRLSSSTINSNNKDQTNGDKTRYLETSVKGGASFYGIAFNVRAKNDVILQTMKILIKTQPKIPNVSIFTKAGSFWNKNDNTMYQPEYWTLISTTEALSYPLLESYSLTSPTANSTAVSIPIGIFNSVSISAGSMQAFYVSLNTSTLVYGRSTNSESSATNNIPTAAANDTYANAICKENDDLSVFVGAGVGPMDLFHQGVTDKNVTMIADRIFNGMLYYTRPFYSSTTGATKQTSSTSYGGAGNDDAAAPPISSSTSTNQAIMQLPTTYEGGNGGFGIMFDIIALQALTVKTLSINVARSTDNRPVEVKVWTLSSGEGSYVGHESTVGTVDWRCIVTCTLFAAGAGYPTVIPEELFPDTYAKAGHVRTFYVSLNIPNLLYTTTNNETYFIALNDDLQIVNGVGFSTPTPIIINTNNSTTTGAQSNGTDGTIPLPTPQVIYHPNRAFNGAIQYILPGTTESTSTYKSISTTIGGANAALGNMFDIEALRDITVKRIDIVITTNKQVNVAIYTKIGSYRGFGEAVNAWTQILSMSVTGAGSYTPVPLVEQYFTSNVFIKAGSVQGFYITLNEPYLSYSAGTSVGNAFAVNDELRMLEGASLLRNFGGLFEPRRWSGVVYYDTNVNSDEKTTSATNFSSSALSESSPNPPTIGSKDVRLIYARSLITTMKGGNGAQGCMFDVSTSIPMFILGIDVHTVEKGEMIDVEMYTKSGTFELNEENSSIWGQPVLSKSVMGRGVRNLTPLPDLNPMIELSGGQVQSFYVRSKTSVLRYSNGLLDTTGNPDLTISLGVGIGDYFQNVFKNRTCNVAIRYLLQTDSQASLAKAVLDNSVSLYTSIGGQKMSFGIMFTLLASEDVLIQTLSIHSATVPAQTTENTTTNDMTYVEVFTKSDSYSGFETNPMAWSKVAASKLKIAGRGRLSQIPPENFLGVLVKAGSQQSFYVTDTESQTIISTVGGEGSPIATPSDHGSPIKVLVGCGIDSYPFGTKISGRLFNGIVHFAPVKY